MFCNNSGSNDCVIWTVLTYALSFPAADRLKLHLLSLCEGLLTLLINILFPFQQRKVDTPTKMSVHQKMVNSKLQSDFHHKKLMHNLHPMTRNTTTNVKVCVCWIWNYQMSAKTLVRDVLTFAMILFGLQFVLQPQSDSRSVYITTKLQ